MASTVQAAAETVKGAVAGAATAVSNTATSALSAATSTAPPTAPHATDSYGAVPTGDEAASTSQKDERPLLNPQDELAKEKLEKLLGERPDRHELVEKNILKNSNVAPGLQAKQAELERSQLEDMLGNKLQARPSPEELVKEGILQKDEIPNA